MGIVDISNKVPQLRKAIARGVIKLKADTIQKIKEKKIDKGDALTISESAALLAVKKTPFLIPHCHPILIQAVLVSFTLYPEEIAVEVEVSSRGNTGVEMEAIAGVSIALCTLWDMVKYLEKDVEGQYPYTSLQNIHVVRKEKSNG